MRHKAEVLYKNEKKLPKLPKQPCLPRSETTQITKPKDKPATRNNLVTPQKHSFEKMKKKKGIERHAATMTKSVQTSTNFHISSTVQAST